MGVDAQYKITNIQRYPERLKNQNVPIPIPGVDGEELVHKKHRSTHDGPKNNKQLPGWRGNTPASRAQLLAGHIGQAERDEEQEQNSQEPINRLLVALAPKSTAPELQKS